MKASTGIFCYSVEKLLSHCYCVCWLGGWISIDCINEWELFRKYKHIHSTLHTCRHSYTHLFSLSMNIHIHTHTHTHRVFTNNRAYRGPRCFLCFSHNFLLSNSGVEGGPCYTYYASFTNIQIVVL